MPNETTTRLQEAVWLSNPPLKTCRACGVDWDRWAGEHRTACPVADIVAAARADLTKPLLALSKMAHYRHDERESGWKTVAYEDCNAKFCYEMRELLDA